MIFLISFGVLVIYSTDPGLAAEQAVFGLFGLILYFFVAFTQTDYFKIFSPFFYFLALTLLTATLFIGILSHGAVRWIPLFLGGVTLQTSELAKFLLIVVLAAFFSSRFWRGNIRSFLICLFIITPPILLVFWQPDLGTTLVIFSIWMLMLVGSGFKVKYLIIFGLAAILVSPILWHSLKAYQRQRLTTFLSPSADPLGAGYHILQSRIAIGSGQIFGRGFGQGTQSRLRFLPEYHNDFIFAALSEEWGLVGDFLILIIFTFMLFRILILYDRAVQPFSKLLCLGVFSMIFSQFAINIGMNLGLAPVTGIPLPLISSGGSSLVTTVLCLGVVQSTVLHKET